MTSILITGANRGLGLEFVKQFLSSVPTPKHIIATCRQPDKADQLKTVANGSNGTVHVVKLDVKDYAQYDQVVKQVGDIVGEDGIDLLINNAGIAIRAGLDDITPEKMIENFEINSVTPLIFTKALLPLLKISASKPNANTLIVNVTSKMGSIDDNTSGGYYAYRASKSALNMITKSLAVDLSKFGINVIALHPGWVKTDMGGQNGLLEVQQSIQHMIATIRNVNKDVAGKMLNYDGKIIPW